MYIYCEEQITVDVDDKGDIAVCLLETLFTLHTVYVWDTVSLLVRC